MNGGQFRAVDLDLLADFVGGALDGTPGAVRVARLIAEDSTWADAHVAMRRGDETVRTRLADWGAEPLSMPPAVADQLAAAIAALAAAGEPAGNAGTQHPAADAGTEDAGAADGGSGVRRLGGPSRSSHPAGPTRPAAAARSFTPGRPPTGIRRPDQAPRRRWQRLAGPVAAVAAIAAIAGFGISQWVIPEGADDAAGVSSKTDAGVSAHAPAVTSGSPHALLAPPAERVLASGTDYSPVTLPQSVRAITRAATRSDVPAPGGSSAPTAGSRPFAGPSAETTSERAASQVPDPRADLDRLAVPVALADCLDAVAAAHARGPAAVELVDYATFQGDPALVVAFTDGYGQRWAWVAGPDCGRLGFGADTRYVASVG